jgi:hypothetical protein
MKAFKNNNTRDILGVPLPAETPSKIHPSLPQGNLIIVAPTSSGKSNMIANMLLRPSFGLCDHFTRVVIMSPTAYQDRLWTTVLQQPGCNIEVIPRYDEAFVTNLLNEQDALVEASKNPKRKKKVNAMGGLPTPITSFETLLLATREPLSQYKGPVQIPEVLVVMDDVADVLPRGGSNTVLERLFMRGRHAHVTCYLSVQSYKRTPRALRLNAQNIIIFAVTESELSVITDELAAESPKKFKAIVRAATNAKFSFIFINTRAPYSERYRLRFQDLIKVTEKEVE